MKTRCYTYIRVSTEMQVEGFSLDSQRERLKKEAAARDFTIVKEYSDEGKSGKSIAGRKGFQSMLARIKGGNPDNVKFVLVYKLSRFGRNAGEILMSLRQMQKHGVELRTVDEGIDSGGPYGKFMISIMAAVAEVERENISAYTMAGRYEKARQGLWNGGQAPFGYTIGKDGVLQIDEEEAPIVKAIFEQYVYGGLGVNGVARWLEANGYRKKVRGNGKYTLFSAHTIKTILDNEVYTGKIVYGRRKIEREETEDGEDIILHRINQSEYGVYEGKHKAIIEADLWTQAQAKRKETSVKHEKTHSLDHEHILSGLLKCPECGAPMYGTVNRKKKKDGSGEYYKDAFYYVCKHRKLIDGQKCTYRRQPPQIPINNEVFAIVRQAITSPRLADILAEYTNAKADNSEIRNQIDVLESKRRQKVRAKDRLARDMDELDAPAEMYDLEYDELQGRYRKLLAEIADIDRQIRDKELDLQKQADAVATAETAQKILAGAGDLLFSDEVEDAGKKLLLNAMIEKVELFPERLKNGRYVKGITFNFPVMLDGEITSEWWYKENTVETVCLMSRVEGK